MLDGCKKGSGWDKLIFFIQCVNEEFGSSMGWDGMRGRF